MRGVERDPALLQYIHESIAAVERYTQGGRASFMDELIVQDAVLRRLETLADAASHLSDELRARHPEIPWPYIAGFRNVAAHGYMSIDLDRVWDTVESHLPALKMAVDQELSRLG